MEELRHLNSGLQYQASDTRKLSLENEQNELEERLQHVHQALLEKVQDLSTGDEQWRTFYHGLNYFGDWLDTKETELNQIHRSSVAPDQQYQQVTVSINAYKYIIVIYIIYP